MRLWKGLWLFQIGTIRRITRYKLVQSCRISTARATIRWRHNEHNSDSNHQCLDCVLNRLFRRRSKKTSKLRVTGLCEGNSLAAIEFPAQRASNAENVSIWWRHHDDGIEIVLHWSSVTDNPVTMSKLPLGKMDVWWWYFVWNVYQKLTWKTLSNSSRVLLMSWHQPGPII